MLERLGTQKHEWVLVELELKCRKLEHKTMEKQHQRERKRDQREREHKQHEVHMLEMWLRISQDSSRGVTQSRNFQEFGLMSELNDTLLPPASPYST